jgi:hypothetical protein
VTTPIPRHTPPDHEVIALTRAWLEHVVIGLNLCPFAESVYRQQQVAYQVSHATEEKGLMDDLIAAIEGLMHADPEKTDTVLLIHPQALLNFEDYNELIGWTEEFLEESGLEAVVQIASFHPDYRFAGTDANDITHNTNRSPFPMLHLLREASVDAALDALPEAAQLVEKNLDTLHDLGKDGWDALIQRMYQAARSSQ